MSETKIHSALVSAYIDSGVMPVARTAFEGKDFTPPSGQSWARLTGLPTDRGPAGLGGSAPQEWTGIFQIDIYHPRNIGHAPILTDADTLLDFFASGKRLEYQGQGVLVRRAERAQIRIEEVWQSVRIDVYCTAWSFQA